MAMGGFNRGFGFNRSFAGFNRGMFAGRSVAMGGFDRGLGFYYTVEHDGFRVVATLAKKDEDAVPVRVVAVLAPSQSLTLSTPHEAGTPPDAVEVMRRADTVLVHKAAVAVTN
jgi:hypothetical protein